MSKTKKIELLCTILYQHHSNNDRVTMTEYVFFYSEKASAYRTDQSRRVFSQWYKKTFNYGPLLIPLPFLDDFEEDTLAETFNCREQWMMYMKALLFVEEWEGNIRIAGRIMKASGPKQIKSLGREIKNFSDKKWKKWRLKIVVNGNYLQFSQDTDMRDILLQTGDKILVEASPYDRNWGIGFRERDALANKGRWGKNLLGQALMQVRSSLAPPDLALE